MTPKDRLAAALEAVVTPEESYRLAEAILLSDGHLERDLADIAQLRRLDRACRAKRLGWRLEAAGIGYAVRVGDRPRVWHSTIAGAAGDACSFVERMP